MTEVIIMLSLLTTIAVGFKRAIRIYKELVVDNE